MLEITLNPPIDVPPLHKTPPPFNQTHPVHILFCTLHYCTLLLYSPALGVCWICPVLSSGATVDLY